MAVPQTKPSAGVDQPVPSIPARTAAVADQPSTVPQKEAVQAKAPKPATEAAPPWSAAKAPGLDALLSEEGKNEVVLFMMEVENHNRASSIPTLVGYQNPWLRALELKFQATWFLIRGHKPAPEDVLAHLKDLHADFNDLLDWASRHRLVPDALKDFRRATNRFEGWFVRWYDRQLVEKEAGNANVGDPEASRNDAIAGELNGLAKKALELDKARVEEGGKVFELPEGKPPEGVGLSIEAARTLPQIVAASHSYHEMKENLEEHSDLAATAAALEVVEKVQRATWALVWIKARAMSKVGSKVASQAGSRLLKILETSEAAEQVETAARALGAIAGTIALVANTLELIDAIREGDEQAIIHAATGVTASGTGLIMIRLGAGSFADVGAVTEIIALYGLTISAMVDLGKGATRLPRI
jgi:hypothetical protein